MAVIFTILKLKLSLWYIFVGYRCTLP